MQVELFWNVAIIFEIKHAPLLVSRAESNLVSIVWRRSNCRQLKCGAIPSKRSSAVSLLCTGIFVSNKSVEQSLFYILHCSKDGTNLLIADPVSSTLSMYYYCCLKQNNLRFSWTSLSWQTDETEDNRCFGRTISRWWRILDWWLVRYKTCRRIGGGDKLWHTELWQYSMDSKNCAAFTLAIAKKEERV